MSVNLTVTDEMRISSKMDDIIEQSKRNVYTKTQSPIDMDCDSFLAKALKNSGAPDQEAMMNSFMEKVSVTPSYPLPKKESGFKIFKNGVISKICVNKEPHGVFCQNDGHLDSAENVTEITEECDPCDEYGPQIKSVSDTWSMAPMRPILATCPILFLVLVSRSSSGASIKEEVFDNLRQTVEDNKKAILSYLKEKFNLDFEVHIVEEVGINGSLLSLVTDCTHHVRGSDLGQHMTGSHITDIFSYHYRDGCAVGIVTNGPGEFTGKLSNHAHFLRKLKKCGVPTEKFIYISQGVEITIGSNGMGVIDDFTIFGGEEMMERARFYQAEEREEIPVCTLPNVDGYISGMTIDLTSRLLRNMGERKEQGGARR
ncbi:uncharacterized protein LOC124200415 isoform X2 [Daphnia pulex]|uniref:uncharacterized protein LOC124200415 isoform X2 n=1 Tax=Daphnia pulex TaxID=6669 RepID=UPI001EE0528B|nr:uncharacterized protein LOC124200415 isoform X2 [Daphnia pulex]